MTLQLTFREPLSGLGSFTDYDLAPLEGAAGTYALRASERPEVRLYVVDAAQYMPDYAPDLGDAAADEGLLLLVVTPHVEGATVNLLAPIVADLATGRAVQVIVADDISKVQVPLRRAA